jgi:hypothetical protein
MSCNHQRQVGLPCATPGCPEGCVGAYYLSVKRDVHDPIEPTDLPWTSVQQGTIYKRIGMRIPETELTCWVWHADTHA